MSLTLNMVGGGGGGLKATDALLRVQSPAGSTVTITKGTTTKTDLGHENADDHSYYDYYFIIHQSQFDSVNPWTITATLGTQTSTSTVIIDTADEYDKLLDYLVPSEYQRVEYLQSDGNQYLLSGWTQPTTWISDGITGLVEIEWMKLTSSNMWVCSCTSQNASGWVGEFEMGMTSTTTVECAYGNTWQTRLKANGTGALNIKYKTAIENTGNSFKAYLNDNQIGSSTANLARNGTEFPLFAQRNGNTFTKASCRIYHFHVSKGGVNIVDLHPCYRKSDSVAGMWDAVNNVFKTNSGSGSFVVGGDI